LPETEENDELNTQDLQERSVLSEVVFELQVELDQHEHGDSDRGTLKDHDPDMSECRM
jgi:hypothetical protein